MRQYTEPSCRHLLRQPLIFGVPVAGVLVLSVVTVSFQIVASGNIRLSCIGFGASGLSYGLLRLATHYAKTGWDQSILFLLERFFTNKNGALGKVASIGGKYEVLSPDTLDENLLLNSKQIFEEALKHLKCDESFILKCEIDQTGAILTQLKATERCEQIRKKSQLRLLSTRFLGHPVVHIYSLHVTPVTSDPLWLYAQLKDLKSDLQVIVSFRGIEQSSIKKRIEAYRRMNSQINDADEVDSDISYEDASHVLRGLSRGDECVVEAALVITSVDELPLDEHFFWKERDNALPLLSILGLRARFHRAHYVRVSTGTDLIPNILDPFESGTPILKTLRGKPLYFDPQDPRLDALHWLVAGATGTGKSFFVGLVLLRMIQNGSSQSVLFIDHKRSFKRLVNANAGTYVEPVSMDEVRSQLPVVFNQLDQPKTFVGIELSDLPFSDKKEAASYVLRQVAEFLSRRESGHVLYVVMDECWKFLKHDPQGVQEAFREFRKFDAAVIAITQSIKDFISDEAGQSIIQNADITVLLRQKEDVTRYQDIFDLNEPEMAKVKQIKKVKGLYSECLIKTPFLSRFGRLYPTEEEHELLRTDNLRSERVALARKLAKPPNVMPGEEEVSCESSS